MLIALASFLIATSIWYLPMFLKHRKVVAEPIKLYVQCFLLGIAAALVTTVLELAILAVPTMLKFGPAVNTDSLAHLVFRAVYFLFAVALLEEASKQLAGTKIAKHVPQLTEAGAMLLFGMVGVGFEFKESMFNSSDIFTGVLRGITDLHIFYQLWMGRYIWRAWRAKRHNNMAAYKKNMCIAVIVPIICHWLFDFAIMTGSKTENDDIAMALIGFAFILGIIFLIIGMISSYKLLKKEKIHYMKKAAAEQ